MKGDESLIGTQISYAKPIFVVNRSVPERPKEYRLTRLCDAQEHVSVSMVHSRLSKPTTARNPCIHKDMSQCQWFTLDYQNQPMQGIHACSQKNILYAVLPGPKLSPADKRYFYENSLV